MLKKLKKLLSSPMIKYGLPAGLAGFLLIAASTGIAARFKPMTTEPIQIVPEYQSTQAQSDTNRINTTETAVFAGGCFWGVQGVFQHVQGVINAVSGYAGGKASTATYAMVSSGLTHHAEAVEITYNPAQISYAQLLQIYFSVAHDPTQKNRQGPDIGTQYRSAIFTNTQQQADIAQSYITQLNQAHVFSKPIATSLEPLQTFYRAEDYHQDFLELNPTHGYIVAHDLPKIAALQKLFANQFSQKPALVFIKN